MRRSRRALASLARKAARASSTSSTRPKRSCDLPPGYEVAIVPGSDTGAFEMAMWNLLGRARRRRPGVGRLRPHLAEATRRAVEARRRARVRSRLWPSARSVASRFFARRRLHLERHDHRACACRTRDWIPADRPGLDLLRCDLGACLRRTIDFAKDRCADLLLAEGAGRRSRARHADPVAARVRAARDATAALAVPKLFRLTKDGGFFDDVFEGVTINTPSMLCVEDYLDALPGPRASAGSLRCSRAPMPTPPCSIDWIAAHAVDRALAADPATRSNTSVCLRFAMPVRQAARPHALAFVQADGATARARRRGPRHRRLSRRAGGLADLVRRDDRRARSGAC